MAPESRQVSDNISISSTAFWRFVELEYKALVVDTDLPRGVVNPMPLYMTAVDAYGREQCKVRVWVYIKHEQTL